MCSSDLQQFYFSAAKEFLKARDIGSVCNSCQLRPECPYLVCQQFKIFGAGEGENPKFVRMGGNNLKRADPNRSGGAKDGDLFHVKTFQTGRLHNSR